MASNAQKTSVALSLNRFAQKKVLDAIQLTGKALPCSIVSVSDDVAGAIVTVKFEIDSAPFTLPQVTIPAVMSDYLRVPYQVGDKGSVIPADVRLGGVSGLGSGVPGFTQPANLSALMFVPLGNATWSAPEDPDKVEVAGPAGVVLKSKNGTAKATVFTDHIVLEMGSVNVTITDTKIELNGELWVNGAKYLDHKHSGVQSGSSNSGTVVP